MSKVTTKLTAKQARFVEEYLVDMNATQAAIRAGYSKKTARFVGCENLTKPYIAAALEVARKERSKRTEVTIDRVVKELALVAFADMGSYLTLDGENTTVRLDWSALPPEATKIIQEITQEEHTGGRGHETGAVRRTKFKLYSKLDALEKLARHLGMFTEKLKIETSFLDDLSPDDLAALVAHLRAAGYGRGEAETRH
jgi:phage terminase small subunit